jgi:hypothetical protein
MANPRPNKKTCVEDCLCLCIHRLPKGRNILRWCQGENEVASVEYERTQDAITIRAQVIAMSPIALSVRDHHFQLATAPSFREIGMQQWIMCECGRKFRKLFLPSGKTEFRCRHCHNLTHRTAQIHNGYLARAQKRTSAIAASFGSKKPARQAFAIKATLSMPTSISSEW